MLPLFARRISSSRFWRPDINRNTRQSWAVGFSWWVRVKTAGCPTEKLGNSHISGPIQNAAYKKEPARKGQNIKNANAWMKFEEWLYIYIISIYLYIISWSIWCSIWRVWSETMPSRSREHVNSVNKKIQPNPSDAKELVVLPSDFSFSWRPGKNSPSLCPVTVYDQNISKYGWKIKMMLKNLILTTVNLLVWIESRLKAN